MSPSLSAAWARFDAQVRYALPSLGLYERMDCRPARELLGWEPQEIEGPIIEMGESLIELGMV